jgi:Macroglobulin domain MG3
VAEYTVQKFQVALQAPSTVSKAKTQLSVPVDATYTFGKPVRGVLTVTASLVLKTVNTWSQLGPPKIVTNGIYGRSVALFDMAEFSIPSDQRYYSILVQASVKEDLTDYVGTGYARTVVVDSMKTASNYKIFSDGFTFVLPGAPLILNLRVGTEDGNALSPTLTTIKVGPSFDAVAVPVQSFQLDGSGKVQVSLNVPATTAISVSLVVSIWCSYHEKANQLDHLCIAGSI